jgi:hypothetical protein
MFQEIINIKGSLLGCVFKGMEDVLVSLVSNLYLKPFVFDVGLVYPKFFLQLHFF